MVKLNTLAKEYMKRSEIFADVFNQFLYHGKQVIVPEKLAELGTAEIAVPYGADNASVPEQRYRDVVKLLMAMTEIVKRFGNGWIEWIGKKVLAPQELQDGYYEYAILVTSSKFGLRIQMELENTGIEQGRIMCNTVGLWEKHEEDLGQN